MTLILIDDNDDDAGSVVVRRAPHDAIAHEYALRDLIFAHPETLPLDELEPEIGNIVAVATEVNLPGAGFVDVLLVSACGRLIVVECKLWRNPQARREVVGQILDYARELARYGYEDLQRVISNRLGRRGNVLYELACEAGSPLGEAAFVDRVTRDLAAGRLLLVIAGDGITEGARRIGDYLGAQAGLAFDLAMVEIAEYHVTEPASNRPLRIVQPRLLTRTNTIERFVIRSDVPDVVITEVEDRAQSAAPTSPAVLANHAAWRGFVEQFVDEVRFDDPAQMPPRYGGLNWMRLPFAGPADLTLYRSTGSADTGVFLRYRDMAGMALFAELQSEREAIDREFAAAGLGSLLWEDGEEEKTISLTTPSPLPWDEHREREQRAWLGRAANQYVNSIAPRISRALG